MRTGAADVLLQVFLSCLTMKSQSHDTQSPTARVDSIGEGSGPDWTLSEPLVSRSPACVTKVRNIRKNEKFTTELYSALTHSVMQEMPTSDMGDICSSKIQVYLTYVR